jgi:hypothetical protein
MYPDVSDVARTLRNLNLPTQPRAENIWPDTVVAFHFLKAATGACYNHGRHDWLVSSELKATVENFIGRPISDDAVAVAIRLLTLKTKASKRDGQCLIWLPPLNGFEQKRDVWSQCQLDVEKQIAAEIQQMEERKVIQAKQINVAKPAA